MAGIISDVQSKLSLSQSGDALVAMSGLAKLHPIEYDRVRQEWAEKLGIRVITLDSEVARLRVQSKSNIGSGSELKFDNHSHNLNIRTISTRLVGA